MIYGQASELPGSDIEGLKHPSSKCLPAINRKKVQEKKTTFYVIVRSSKAIGPVLSFPNLLRKRCKGYYSYCNKEEGKYEPYNLCLGAWFTLELLAPPRWRCFVNTYKIFPVLGIFRATLSAFRRLQFHRGRGGTKFARICVMPLSRP